MRDLTSQRVALHTQTRRFKLLFVLSVGLWICGGGDHTNVFSWTDIATCQMFLIGTVEQVTLPGKAFKRSWQV